MLLCTCTFAEESGATNERPTIENQVPADCWAPGEPGADVLPPCDPSVTPVKKDEAVAVTTFEAAPRWWEFWKDDWCVWPE